MATRGAGEGRGDGLAPVLQDAEIGHGAAKPAQERRQQEAVRVVERRGPEGGAGFDDLVARREQRDAQRRVHLDRVEAESGEERDVARRQAAAGPKRNGRA